MDWRSSNHMHAVPLPQRPLRLSLKILNNVVPVFQDDKQIKKKMLREDIMLRFKKAHLVPHAIVKKLKWVESEGILSEVAWNYSCDSSN